MIDVSTIERVAALDEHLGSVSIDDFAVLWAAHERLGARLALTIARFDAGREYAADDGGLAAFALPDVRPRRHRLVARGRFLRDHDIVAEAATTSTLSAGQINAFRGNVDPRRRDRVRRARQAVDRDHRPVGRSINRAGLSGLAPTSRSDQRATRTGRARTPDRDKLLPNATAEITNPNSHTQTSQPKPVLDNMRLQR